MDTGTKGIKQNLAKAAWELFRKKGYEDTTIDDIIKKAGASKSSFYYYFDGKESLLDTLADMLDDEYRRLEKEIDPEMNSFDKLLYLNDEVHKYIEDNISMDILASLYSAQLVSKGNRKLLDRNRKYYRFVSEIIEEGQARGEISKEMTIYEITKYFVLCESALVSDWCLYRGSYSLASYSREIMPIMLEHIRKKEQR